MQLIILRRNILFLYFAQAFFLTIGSSEPISVANEPVIICFDDFDYQVKIEQLFATPVLLEKVTFVSDINFEQSEFKYLTAFQEGQLISVQAIKNAFFYLDLRQLFSKIVLKVSWRGSGCFLHFDLTSHLRVNSLNISGVLFGKERYRQLYSMQPGERFELAKHTLALKKIINFLKNEGYLNATVDAQIKSDLKTKQIDINLKIRRGKKFKIGQLDINLWTTDQAVNKEKISQEDHFLRQIILRLIQKSFFYKKYSTKLLITELAKLKKIFAKFHYPFAQISFNIFKNLATKKIKIVFNICLKQKQVYKFVGNHFFSNDDLFDYLMLGSGLGLRLPISLLLCDLMDFYRKNGFEQVMIQGKQTDDCYEFLITEGQKIASKKSQKQSQADLNPANSKARNIESTQPVILGKTVLRGNAKMRFDRLSKFLPYQIGELLDSRKLEMTLFRIKNLDSFDAIRLYPSDEIDQVGYKPLILDLNMDHKLELRTRLGFQKVSKNFDFQAGGSYKAGVSVLYKNITECGDQLVFDADLTRFYRYVVAKYKRPIFMHVPLYFATNLYINKYDQPIFIGSKNCLYHIYQQGALVDLGYQGQVLNVNLNLGLEGDMVSDLSEEYARAIDFSDALLATQVPFLFIEPTMIIDYLDDKMAPTNGLFMLATVKGMVAIGSKESYFLKLLLEQSAFLPAFKNSVFAMRLSFGHIFTDQFNVIMPLERFYLGGAYSVRSYEPDFAPPLGVVTTSDCKDILVPQGGKTMMNACFELRVPIYQNLSGVLFQDLGTLIKSGAGLGDGELLSATGFGLRYKTPVGPVRFDIGWRPKKGSDSPNFAWFLTIGNAF